MRCGRMAWRQSALNNIIASINTRPEHRLWRSREWEGGREGASEGVRRAEYPFPYPLSNALACSRVRAQSCVLTGQRAGKADAHAQRDDRDLGGDGGRRAGSHHLHTRTRGTRLTLHLQAGTRQAAGTRQQAAMRRQQAARRRRQAGSRQVPASRQCGKGGTAGGMEQQQQAKGRKQAAKKGQCASAQALLRVRICASTFMFLSSVMTVCSKHEKHAVN